MTAEPLTVPTYCDECMHRIPGQSDRLDMCAQHKRLFNPSFVRSRQWDGMPPFLRCVDVNGGACLLFQPVATSKTGDAK